MKLPGDCVVAYVLKRSHRRSIGFSISSQGLCVSAPHWVLFADIEQALRGKAGWVLRKLAEQRNRDTSASVTTVFWGHGSQVPYLGRSFTVCLDARNHLGHCPERAELHLAITATATAEQVRDAVHHWLKHQARLLFAKRCEHFAALLGVQPKHMSLSSAKTRWGSASSNGSIRLNWRLIHLAPHLIDYVIAHELAHLREMNHSPAFWSLVRSVVPELDAARKELKNHLSICTEH